MQRVSLDQCDTFVAQGRVLLYFTASWCSACAGYTTLISMVQEEFPEGFPTVGMVDADEDRHAVVEKFHLSVLPTLILFDNGVALARLDGSRPMQAIQDLVQARS